MKQNMRKSVFLTLILVGILILILLVNSMIFVQGPYLKERDIFYQAHQNVMEQLRAKDGKLLNRYSLNEVTYVSRIRSLSRDWIVWYDETGKIREQIAVSEIDSEGALSVAYEHGIDNDRMNYGWIDGRPALVFEDKDRELLLDARSLKVLMDFEKR